MPSPLFTVNQVLGVTSNNSSFTALGLVIGEWSYELMFEGKESEPGMRLFAVVGVYPAKPENYG